MSNKLLLAIALFTVMVMPISGNVAAQAMDTEELRKQIQVFSGVLQEGLSLDSTPGFLGIRSGRVTSLYLQNQGVLFEIRTPLANQRNRVSLNTLASSIRGISGNGNPFEAMVRSQTTSSSSESRVLGQASELAMEAVQRTADTLRAIDYQATIDATLREAYRGARMLKDIGEIDESDMADLGQELNSLSQQLRESLQQLRQLEDESITGNTAPGDIAQSQSAGSDRREQARATLQALAEQARQKAADIDLQYQQARAEYRQRWLQQVASFEDSLFGLLCDYGATLRELPVNEYITVVLAGLGADSEQAVPLDRLHVVAKTDLLACQSGELDWQALRLRADSYNY